MSDWIKNPPKSVSEQWELAQKAKAAPEIAWKAEKEKLESQRATPRRDSIYTPEGSVVKEVNQAEAARREAEIKRINDALQQRKGSLKRDFDREKE